MSNRKVLLITEGRRGEPQLMKRLFEEYGLDAQYSIYTYGTVVHDLYRRLFTEGDSIEDLDLLGVLKERESDEDKRALLDEDFSDILLIFDYDPHDNRFDPDMLCRMAERFNESTDMGKLFVNYPMLEACKHFRTLPDEGYQGRCVSFEDIPRYKEIVGAESAYQSYERHFTRGVFDGAIAATVRKACLLCGGSGDAGIAEMYGTFTQLDLAEEQNSRLTEGLPIAVLGTCVLFICDYSPDLLQSEL